MLSRATRPAGTRVARNPVYSTVLREEGRGGRGRWSGTAEFHRGVKVSGYTVQLGGVCREWKGADSREAFGYSCILYGSNGGRVW